SAARCSAAPRCATAILRAPIFAWRNWMAQISRARTCAARWGSLRRRLRRRSATIAPGLDPSLAREAPMADPDQVALLRSGVAAWNAWRSQHAETVPDLAGA